jgi:hypothetical protein
MRVEIIILPGVIYRCATKSVSLGKEINCVLKVTRKIFLPKKDKASMEMRL